MAGTIPAVSTEEFEGVVIGSELPVLVDFWAPWCGPCLAVAPLLEQLAEELARKLRIVKVDIDQHPELGDRFAVSSIPTFILFKGGEPADRMLGAMPKAAFRELVGRFI